MNQEKQIRVEDVSEETLWYVACCAQGEDGEGLDEAGQIREDWMRMVVTRGGMQAKVAMDGDEPVGFLFLVPVERTAWYVEGQDLYTVQCMNVEDAYQGQGVAAQLVDSAEAVARRHSKGMAVIAYEPSDWFMPASFFANLGYQEVERRGTSVLMFKSFSEDVAPPSLVPRQYRPPRLLPGKVIVEAFWSPQCLTTALEILHVREVCEELGEDVILHEYNASMPGMRERFGIPRTIFINGVEKGWGFELPHAGSFDGAERTWSHEAPKQWLRQEIKAALEESQAAVGAS